MNHFRAALIATPVTIASLLTLGAGFAILRAAAHGLSLPTSTAYATALTLVLGFVVVGGVGVFAAYSVAADKGAFTNEE